MNSGPDTPPPLQFDTAVPSLPSDAPAAAAGVTCVGCQRVVADEYFDINGHSTCAACRDSLSQQAQTPTGAEPLIRAGGFGLVAAILGATLYYAVIAITDLEIGIVAIAIGYMVGYGIRLGTKGRGGRRFQVMAIVLTYWAVGLAYTPIFIKAAQEQEQTDTQGGEEATAAAKATEDAAATDDGSAQGISPAYFVAIVLGFTFALPLIAIFGSLPGGLISAAIIGFGMQQAWRMTAAPQLTISGPYRVGAAPPAVS